VSDQRASEAGQRLVAASIIAAAYGSSTIRQLAIAREARKNKVSFNHQLAHEVGDILSALDHEVNHET